MRSKLPWFLLVGSLLLNAFFIGGVVTAKMTADGLRGPPDGRAAELLADLDLSQAERRELQALRQALQERRKRMREEMAPLRRRLIDEVRQPGLDEPRVGELLQERSTFFVAHMAGVMAELHAYLERLEPAKKEAILARMEEDPRFLWRLMREPRQNDRR